MIPGMPAPGSMHHGTQHASRGTQNANANNNPANITQDPDCPDTQADGAGGALGALAFLLRKLIDKLLPPWYYPPVNFQAFDKQGVLVTPAIGASGIVLTLTVPQGYASACRRLSINVVGPGFVQGSGELVFSVTVDNAPYKNYASILTEFGSVQIPRDTDGILANSGQVYRVTVLNVSYAALGTNIVASLGGWFYPDRKKQRRNG
jgi:hypothetical protein